MTGTGDDHEQIRQLKYAYLRHLDLKQWDAFEALFLPEATGSYADLGSPTAPSWSATCART